jgi:hypothetical protein
MPMLIIIALTLSAKYDASLQMQVKCLRANRDRISASDCGSTKCTLGNAAAAMAPSAIAAACAIDAARVIAKASLSMQTNPEQLVG